MSQQPDTPYPTTLSAEDQGRFVAATCQSPGINVPPEALEAIAPYVAEDLNGVLLRGEDGVERLRPERIESVRTEAGNFRVATVLLAGCAGSVWERNERRNTSWSSPGAPTASVAEFTLPRLRSFRGSDGAVHAAICAEFDSKSQSMSHIQHASDVLKSGEGKRGYELDESLAVKGQTQACLLVAQQYLTPTGHYWRSSAVV